MNNKTKKIVAGVVLGTFVFGATTPAFAEISKPNINSSVTSITEQNEKTLPLYSNADSETARTVSALLPSGLPLHKG